MIESYERQLREMRKELAEAHVKIGVLSNELEMQAGFKPNTGHEQNQERGRIVKMQHI